MRFFVLPFQTHLRYIFTCHEKGQQVNYFSLQPLQLFQIDIHTILTGNYKGDKYGKR